MNYLPGRFYYSALDLIKGLCLLLCKLVMCGSLGVLKEIVYAETETDAELFLYGRQGTDGIDQKWLLIMALAARMMLINGTLIQSASLLTWIEADLAS